MRQKDLIPRMTDAESKAVSGLFERFVSGVGGLAKPRISLVRCTGSQMFECKGTGPTRGGLMVTRYGYGRTMRMAYESWVSGVVNLGDWA